MHRGKYKEFDTEEGCIIDLNTGENLGKHLDLWCYTADENNIYYDTPHIDYPDHYAVQTESQTIPLNDIFMQRGDYSVPYVIVSRHKKLTSIEPFHIDECNSFYSVPMSGETANFISYIGLENFFVKENLWDFNLNAIKSSNNLSGEELIFFIDSDDSEIRRCLNELRLRHLLDKLNVLKTNMIESGVPVFGPNSFENFTYTLADKYHLNKVTETDPEKIFNVKNAGRDFELNIDTLTDIKNRLTNKEDLINKYSNELGQFYIKIFTGDMTLSNLESKYSNCLYFGYLNDEIKEKLL